MTDKAEAIEPVVLGTNAEGQPIRQGDRVTIEADDLGRVEAVVTGRPQDKIPPLILLAAGLKGYAPDEFIDVYLPETDQSIGWHCRDCEKPAAE